jgi:type IV pilus assembly protein PilE
MRKANHQTGFTLVELMIVVTIIGILSAIVYPGYTDYVRRAKITEATSALADLRIRMEQYFQDNRTYEDANFCAPTVAPSYFNFACTSGPDEDGYVISAVGTGDMAGYSYTIDQDNSKTSVVPGGGGNCWAMQKNGTC